MDCSAYVRQHHLKLGGEAEYWTLKDGRMDGLSLLLFPHRETPEQPLPGGGKLIAELPVQQVEVTTGICSDEVSFQVDMETGKQTLQKQAAVHGYTLSSSSVPPHEGFPLDVFPKQRYLDIQARTAERGMDLSGGWTGGRHIHCGLESIDAYVTAHNTMRRLLPMMLHLSLEDVAVGSPRILKQERFISGDMCPPELEGSGDLFAHIWGTFQGNSSACYWGYRPNLPIGTGELRILEMQSSPVHMAQLAAAARVITAMALDGIHLRGASDDPAQELRSVARGEVLAGQYQKQLQAVYEFACEDRRFITARSYLRGLMHRRGLSGKDQRQAA